MKKDIILYIGGFIPPDKNAAAHRVMANTKVIESIGYEVVWLGSTPSGKMNKCDVRETKQNVQGITTYFRTYPTSFIDWFKQLTMIDDVEKVINDVGIKSVKTIIAYNYPSIALRKLLKYCRKNSIYLICDCTEWAIADTRNSIRNQLKNLDTFYRMRFVNIKVDGLIAISKYLYEYYSPRMKNVIKLPPLIDKKDKKWNSSSILNLNDGIRLVYAGSPGQGNKDRLDLIVESCIEVDKRIGGKITLTIIGITKKQFVDNFDRKSSLNLTDNIFFLGRISHLEALDIIKKSHFSIFIRDKNIVNTAGFPTKFVESISCGTPVLTNSTSNLSEYLDEGKLGYFVDTLDSRTLTQSLIEVFKKKDDIRGLKKLCKKVTVFDIASNKDQIIELINKLHINND